jgi:hypothetical protein
MWREARKDTIDMSSIRPADVTCGSASPGKGQRCASFDGGDEQRHALAATLEHDVSESPSSVHACMPFEDVCRTDRRHDVIWWQVFEDAIRGAIALRGFFERYRLLGQPELQRAIPMIADGSTRERTRRRDPVAATIRETKRHRQQHRRSQRPPSLEPEAATSRSLMGRLLEPCWLSFAKRLRGLLRVILDKAVMRALHISDHVECDVASLNVRSIERNRVGDAC